MKKAYNGDGKLVFEGWNNECARAICKIHGQRQAPVAQLDRAMGS